jgi:dTDP-4-dehydrorhamnose 3,5-epimerase
VIFSRTGLSGAFLVQPEKHSDTRGFFVRLWCQREFEAQGLNPRLVQASLSHNRRAGTLRGLHYQAAPHAEVKLIRCTKGALYDVLVDLRPTSPTYARWIGVELSAENYQMLYAPEGVAHGFQTLTDDTEVVYQMSEFYSPSSERGVRYDDPVFGIRWPLEVSVISTKDAQWPDFKP